MENSRTLFSLDCWKKMELKWSGGHQILLPTANSPAVSTCTTSTNLSDIESQPNSKMNAGIVSEEKLKRTISEVQPLQPKSNQKSYESSDEEIYDSENKLTPTCCPHLHQILTSIAVSFVSMVVGYCSGYTSASGSSWKEELKISNLRFSGISGSMPLAAMIGGLIGGPLIEKYGRRRIIVVTNVLFLIGWIFSSFPIYFKRFLSLYATRIISGFAMGIATLTLPVYLGETIQPEIRGTLGLLPTVFGNMGILICFLMGLFLQWKENAGVGAVLSFIILLFVWLIPETPRWYISKDETEQARKSLKWLRNHSDPSTLNKELENLLETQKTSNEKKYTIRDLFSRANIKPVAIILGLMFFQQMSGINAIIFYTTQIFEDAGSDIPPAIQTIIVGVVNFGSTFIATLLIDKLGRKILLYVSSVAMMLTLLILGFYFYQLSVSSVDTSSYGWIPLASSIIYVLGFSLGFGPIPWLMMGEILPAKIRGSAASMCTAFNWLCTFIVTTSFNLIKAAIGTHVVFWMFSVMVTLGLVFTISVVPETKGQSLEEIERKLVGAHVERTNENEV